MPDETSWVPRLVALDIDGTLFDNEPATGEQAGVVTERISPAVVAAVTRAYDAGAHVVLATGRSTFGITSYVGVPIRDSSGAVVATLCGIDRNNVAVESRSRFVGQNVDRLNDGEDA